MLSEVVGLELVLQHTPFAVMEAPPSLIDSPPLDADEHVVEEIAVVVIVGADADEHVKSEVSHVITFVLVLILRYFVAGLLDPS